MINYKSNHNVLQTYKIGLIKIKRTSKQQPIIKPSYELRDLTDTNTYINDEKYQGQLRQCFIQADTAEFRSLNLVRNYNSEILKEISHISFISLRVLELSGNHIESIEPLTWVNMKSLKVLDLKQNYILEAKPLAKLYTRNLNELKLGLNLFNSLQCLTRMKFREHEGNRDLSLVFNTSLKPYNNLVNDLSFLAKLDEPKQLQEQWINVYHKRRIIAKKLYQAISRRGNKKKTIVISDKMKMMP